MGLTRNFHGKKGGPGIFLRSEGGPRTIFAISIFLHQAPLTSVCERSLSVIYVLRILLPKVESTASFASLSYLYNRIRLSFDSHFK